MRIHWWQNLPMYFAPDGEGAGGGGNGGGAAAGGGDGGQAGAGGAGDGGAAGAGGDAGAAGKGAAAGQGDGKGDGGADKGGQAGAGGDGGKGDGGQQGADDWRSGIQDQKLRDYAGKFTTPADLAKSALEFRQKLSTAIVLPGKDASEDEVKAFHKKLGVPDKPEGYEVNLPDNLPESLQLNDASKAQLDAFKKAMHAAGAPPPAVQAAVGWYYGTLVDQVTAGEQVAERGRADAETALKREWGNDFDGNVRYAQRAAKAFGGEAFVTLVENATVNGVKLGDHPDFMRTFAAIGRRMGEDNLHVGAMTGEEQKTLQEQHTDLSRQIADAHAKGDRDKARQLDQQRQQISTKLYGSTPIVGTAGRTV